MVTVNNILTSTQCMPFENWQSRNNIKYDNTILRKKTIITKINKQLHTIINAHFIKHKSENI